MCGTNFQQANSILDEGKVLDKIQTGKDYFTPEKITKSGRNPYRKYNYLEPEDIFPVVRQVCKDLKLRTKFQFTETTATLMIQDREDKSKAYYNLPVAPIHEKDAGRYMQEVGKNQTYAMRYLYIQAFEIAIPDKIEKSSQKISKSKKTKNTMKSSNQIIQKGGADNNTSTPDINQTTFQTNPQQQAINNIKQEMKTKGYNNPNREQILQYIEQEQPKAKLPETIQLHKTVQQILGAG